MPSSERCGEAASVIFVMRTDSCCSDRQARAAEENHPRITTAAAMMRCGVAQNYAEMIFRNWPAVLISGLESKFMSKRMCESLIETGSPMRESRSFLEIIAEVED